MPAWPVINQLWFPERHFSVSGISLNQGEVQMKSSFMRDRSKLSFPMSLAASPLARAFSQDSPHPPKIRELARRLFAAKCYVHHTWEHTWPIGNKSYLQVMWTTCTSTGSDILMNGQINIHFSGSKEHCGRGPSPMAIFFQKACCSAILVKYWRILRLLCCFVLFCLFVCLFFLPLLSTSPWRCKTPS